MADALRVEEVQQAVKIAAGLAREEGADKSLIQLLDRIGNLDEPELRVAIRSLAALMSALLYAQQTLKDDEKRIMAAMMGQRRKAEVN